MKSVDRFQYPHGQKDLIQLICAAETTTPRKMRSFVARYPVLVFVSVALAIQFTMVAFVHALVPDGVSVNDVPEAHNVFRLRVFVPIILVTFITWYLEGGVGLRKLFDSFFHWRAPAKWYALAVSWKFIMAFIAIALAYLVYDLPVDWYIPGKMGDLLAHMPFIIGIALVEETAWIRFSLTRMQSRYNAFWSCMIVGNCWAMWYLPMNLIDIGTPLGVPDIVFHSGVVSLTVLLAWVYNSTRSGTVLLVMQILSNMAFFIAPVLPTEVLPPHRIIMYAWVFVFVAITLIVVFGVKNLSRKPRVSWEEDEELAEEAAQQDPPLAQLARPA